MQEKQRLSKRLRPLYWVTLFQSCMLWYATEKLFMSGIGFNNAQIALAGVLISATMVVLQVPTGILADRWSRKGSLILASVLLAFNVLVGLLSHSVTPYLVYASILWGAFASIRSGVYDTLVYDTLLEETGHSKEFEHYYGRLQVYANAGIIVAALLSGVVGKFFGLRATFWISIPFIALSIMALIKFKEPLVHKSQPKISLIRHTAQTLTSVIRTGYVVWIVLAMVLFGMISRLMFNLSPVWYLAFALPVVWWGPAYALIHISGVLAGSIATFTGNNRFKVFSFALFISLASLVLVSNILVIAVVLAQTIVLAGYAVFGILLGRHLHDALPSHIRAGSSSVVGTLAQLVFLPVAYLFGWLSNSYSVFQAAWVVVIVTVVAVTIYCFRILPSKSTFSGSEKDTIENGLYTK